MKSQTQNRKSLCHAFFLGGWKHGRTIGFQVLNCITTLETKMEPKNHPIDKGKSPSPNPPLLEFHGEIFRGIKQAKTRKVFWINLEHSMTMSQWNKQTANRSSNLSRKIIYIDTLPKTNVLAPTRRPGHKRKTHLPTPSVLKEGKFLKLSFEPPWLWDPSPGRFDGCAWQLILGGGDPVKPAACMYFFVLLPPPAASNHQDFFRPQAAPGPSFWNVYRLHSKSS